MDAQRGLLLSVRGEAQVTVAPDFVVLFCPIVLTRNSKAQALADSAAALHRLTTDLAALGALALTADTGHAALTWSARSATTWDEIQHDKFTGQSEPTGKVNATVDVQITARALGAMDALGAHLSTHEDVHVRHVSWRVDADNPGWARVRAEAIHTAIGKGRDYAAALGAAVQEVLHVADAGLLDGGAGQVAPGHALSAMFSHGGAPPDVPSLDPEPQVLSAIIDARLQATAVAMTR
ncbi:MAG TPA: SIMPL domain-containing protein [Acidothermaceae bacterium]